MLSSYLILIHAPTKDATISPLFMTGLRAILIHASAREATMVYSANTFGFHYFNPRVREGCDLIFPVAISFIVILIHASARDATAKSYKIGNNFTVLFRKFVQIFDILILHISIFLEKQEQYFYFCSANLPGFLRCFRFAPTFSYIVCQNLRLVDFSVEVF